MILAIILAAILGFWMAAAYLISKVLDLAFDD